MTKRKEPLPNGILSGVKNPSSIILVWVGAFLARNKEIPSQHSPEGLLVGYFTAQTLLFLDGQTQSLWVEHISYSSLQARDQLSELAYKLAREKHFQRVFFPNASGIINSINSYKPESWNPQSYLVKTVK